MVDYDLIVPSAVNTTTGEKTVSIKVKKKGIGYEGDTNNTEELTAAGKHDIKIQQWNGSRFVNLISWTITINEADIKIRLVSTTDESIVWDEEVIEVVKDGSDAYVLNLTNDNEIAVKNNAGIYVSTFPIETTAELYAGDEKITSGVSYEWKLGSTSKVKTSKLSLDPNPKQDSDSILYEVGEYTVTATIDDTDKTFTKTFTVREVTAEVDYDLIVPTAINLDTSSSTIQVKVLKTGIGYDGDTSNSATLTAKGNHLIKL
jgi:hypothetical protein